MAKTYKARSGFIKRTIAGETLLVAVGPMSQEFNGMITLNETGEYLWTLLNNAKAKEELISEMKKEFNASIEEISHDVDQFLENGIKDKLIIEE